jgi:hypothetical protein
MAEMLHRLKQTVGEVEVAVDEAVEEAVDAVEVAAVVVEMARGLVNEVIMASILRI